MTINDMLSTWSAAEASGDAAALEVLLTDDFAGVGPLGFVLDKQQWIDRFRNGSFTYDSFALDDVEMRRHGDTTTVLALQKAPGAYNGNPTPPVLRISAVVVGADDAAKLASVHSSFVAGTPGAPPIPGQEH